MGATKYWLYFAFLVIFVSLKGVNTSKTNAGIKTKIPKQYPDGHTVTVLEKIKSDVNWIEKTLESLLEYKSSKATATCKFDFENGILLGWKKTGFAFYFQPTYGDNPTARNSQPAKQQGDWWIGGLEHRPSKSSPAGRIQGDYHRGTLTSPTFKIIGKRISFLIGGTCRKSIRAELIIGGHKVVKTAKGTCNETMKRKEWDVEPFIGLTAQVRLVDHTKWGHINFDDLKGDINCF